VPLLLLILAQAAPAPPAPGPGNLASYFSTADYPKAAIRRREQGTVWFRVEIGPDGRVTRCAVTRSSGSAALDSTTCRLAARRFRYRPATDAAGHPVSDVKDGLKVDWRLP
jgi:protein TonB